AWESESGEDVELLRLPRVQTAADLIRIFLGIGGELDRVTRDDRRRLVMLPAAFARRRQRDHDVGTDHSHQPHVIRRDLVAAPFLESLLDAERESKVDRAGEILLGAVEAVQRLELLGSQDAERLENLRTDLVLSAVATRRRRVRCSIALA